MTRDSFIFDDYVAVGNAFRDSGTSVIEPGSYE